MDIKERFYANLETIREDYEQKYKEAAALAQKWADEDEKNRKRKGKKKNRINQKWSKLWSSAAESSRKRAVTGMDEEAEQLDELKGYRSRQGQKLLQKVQKRSVDRMIKAADKGDAKTAKKYREVADNAWDRFEIKEEEQLNELRRPKNPDKGKKHIPQAAKARENHEAEEYYKASDENAEARKNYMTTKKGMDKVEKTEKKRIRAAKIVRKLQKIGDKK